MAPTDYVSDFEQVTGIKRGVETKVVTAPEPVSVEASDVAEVK